MPVATPRIGGTFAPPIGGGQLDDYEILASKASGPVGDSMLKLIMMVRKFQETPASSLPGTPHRSGVGLVVPLEPAEVERIDPVVPWEHELDAMARLFDGINLVGQKALRDAAFHLLWYGRELFLDREPMTKDRLN